MLAEASKREVDGDLMLNVTTTTFCLLAFFRVALTNATHTNTHFCEQDIGQGFGFRPGVFDGAISISAVQWLCYSHDADHIAKYVLGCVGRECLNHDSHSHTVRLCL